MPVSLVEIRCLEMQIMSNVHREQELSQILMNASTIHEFLVTLELKNNYSKETLRLFQEKERLIRTAFNEHKERLKDAAPPS